MALPSPSSSKSAPDMGLSPLEVRVLLLGMVFSVDGKVDFEKLAARTGYTLGSARVTFNTARRKLFRLHGEGADGQVGAAPVPRMTRSKSMAGRKRKQAPGTPAAESDAEEGDTDVYIKGEYDDDE